MNIGELQEGLWLIGLSLAANGLLWYLIGNWNVRNAKGKTIGPLGSNFKKIEVEGPEAVELVAARLRDFVTRHADLPPVPPVGYVSEREHEQVEVTNLGDIARMLDLPVEQALYPSESVRLRQIRTADDAL